MTSIKILCRLFTPPEKQASASHWVTLSWLDWPVFVFLWTFFCSFESRSSRGRRNGKFDEMFRLRVQIFFRFDVLHLWFSDNKVMLIMSIGELAILFQQEGELEQKTNKLLILCVELILLSTSSFQQKKFFLYLEVFISINPNTFSGKDWKSADFLLLRQN